MKLYSIFLRNMVLLTLVFLKTNVFTMQYSLPLIQACKENNVPLVRQLLCDGADPNAIDFKGNAAAHYAAKKQNLALLELLFAHNGNMLQCNFALKKPFEYIQKWTRLKKLHASLLEQKQLHVTFDHVQKEKESFQTILSSMKSMATLKESIRVPTTTYSEDEINHLPSLALYKRELPQYLGGTWPSDLKFISQCKCAIYFYEIKGFIPELRKKLQEPVECTLHTQKLEEKIETLECSLRNLKEQMVDREALTGQFNELITSFPPQLKQLVINLIDGRYASEIKQEEKKALSKRTEWVERLERNKSQLKLKCTQQKSKYLEQRILNVEATRIIKKLLGEREALEQKLKEMAQKYKRLQEATSNSR